MCKPSKLQLEEARGLALLTPEGMESVYELLHNKSNFKPNFDLKLSDNVIADLKALRPYLQDTLYEHFTFEQLVDEFQTSIFPEGDLFFWQNQVIYTLHALNLKNYPGHPVERPKPPSIAELAHPGTLRKYLSYPQRLRKHLHEIILHFSTCLNATIGGPEHIFILDAWYEVTASIKLMDEIIGFQKTAAIRLAKTFGSICSACQSVGKGKRACTRCYSVFYCGKECQKAHWPHHKRECAKEEDTTGSCH